MPSVIPYRWQKVPSSNPNSKDSCILFMDGRQTNKSYGVAWTTRQQSSVVTASIAICTWDTSSITNTSLLWTLLIQCFVLGSSRCPFPHNAIFITFGIDPEWNNVTDGTPYTSTSANFSFLGALYSNLSSGKRLLFPGTFFHPFQPPSLSLSFPWIGT